MRKQSITPMPSSQSPLHMRKNSRLLGPRSLAMAEKENSSRNCAPSLGMDESCVESDEESDACTSERESGEGLQLSKRPNIALPYSVTKRCRLTSDCDLPEGVIPKNTEKNDRWALNVFRKWMSTRNRRSESKCPDDIIQRDDAELLNKWLSLFVSEVRKSDGTKYPPQTIHLILCGLQRYMRRHNAAPVSIFDKTDVRFRGLQGTTESVYQTLHEEGLGVEVKHASVITADDEEKLWESKTLGDYDPHVLLRTVFFLNGRNLALRGGQKQRNLKLSQFVREKDHWKYIENDSKNFRRGIRRENRVVCVYPHPELGNRCHFHILETYMTRIPMQAKEKDVFYLTALKVVKWEVGNVWFSLVPVGRNKLDLMVKEMCSRAGISEVKSNLSLRATGATRLFRKLDVASNSNIVSVMEPGPSSSSNPHFASNSNTVSVMEQGPSSSSNPHVASNSNTVSVMEQGVSSSSNPHVASNSNTVSVMEQGLSSSSDPHVALNFAVPVMEPGPSSSCNPHVANTVSVMEPGPSSSCNPQVANTVSVMEQGPSGSSNPRVASNSVFSVMEPGPSSSSNPSNSNTVSAMEQGIHRSSDSKAMPQRPGFYFSGCTVIIYNSPVNMQASQSQQIELR